MNFWRKWRWPWQQARSSPPGSPPAGDVLDLPLLYFSSRDVWRIRDACEGVQIFGSIGSGKTSGSGAALAKAFLRAGMGGLVLCAKPEERQLWERYAAETGRSQHLVIFGPDQPWRFNFLAYEMQREGKGGRLSENILALLNHVIEIVAGGKIRQTGDSAYWERGKDELLRNAIDLLSLARGTITLEDLYQLIADAPQSTAQVADAEWQASSFCAECIRRAEAKQPKTVREEHDFQAAVRYFLHSYANLDPKPRSGIVSTVSGVIDVLLHGICWELLCTKTNLTPEVTYKDAAVIILDLPIQEFSQVGIVVQQIFKLMFQRAILRRDVRRNPLPVFLWADEAQAVALNSFDYQYQAVARSARACTVYLTQNISNYYAAMGSGSREAADSLLGLFQTCIFHANSDSVTNRWASERIAEERTTNFNFSSGANPGGASHSTGGSQAIRYKVLPAQFTTLRKGGPPHFQVEAIVFQGGRIWNATIDTYILSIFVQ